MIPSTIRLTSIQKLIGAAFLFLAAGLLALGWWQLNASAAQVPTLDDDALREKGLALAHSFGLQGNPTSEKAMRMTLEEAGQLVGAELGKDAGQFGLAPGIPVFVFAIRGEIEPTGPRQINPDDPNPKYDRMLIILNAHDGGMIIQAEYYVDAPMPVELP